MLICKDCRCFIPVTVSDRYCGECVIGDTRNPIAINDEVTSCCLFEPKQPNKQKPLTNSDRIRQMTNEELAESISFIDCSKCPLYNTPCEGRCKEKFLEWLKQEVQKIPEVRLIDANALKDRLPTFEGVIDEQPTVEAEPVRYGQWIEDGEICGIDKYKCSLCGGEVGGLLDNTKYCCFCGAKMDGGTKK